MSESEEANYRDLIVVHKKNIERMQREILVHLRHVRILEKRLSEHSKEPETTV